MVVKVGLVQDHVADQGVHVNQDQEEGHTVEINPTQDLVLEADLEVDLEDLAHGLDLVQEVDVEDLNLSVDHELVLDRDLILARNHADQEEVLDLKDHVRNQNHTDLEVLGETHGLDHYLKMTSPRMNRQEKKEIHRKNLDLQVTYQLTAPNLFHQVGYERCVRDQNLGLYPKVARKRTDHGQDHQLQKINKYSLFVFIQS